MFQVLLTALVLGAVPVESDYLDAKAKAEEQGKLLIVACGCDGHFQEVDPNWQYCYVFCQVPASATISIQGKDVPLIQHSSLAQMEGPGVFIVNYQFGRFRDKVISVLPRRHVTRIKVAHLLALPEGSLTQRTLIWALRTHPESPRSVWRRPSWRLFKHAERHSLTQANADSQFHANIIQAGVSEEIIAESWPENHNVVDAAVDIVQSWRGSSHHWSACCNGGPAFGYDMKRIRGRWFATGAFSSN